MKALRLAFFATMTAFAFGMSGCELLGFGDDDEEIVVPDDDDTEDDDDEDDEQEVITVMVFDGTKSGSVYDYLYIDLEDPENPSSTGEGTSWDIMITGQKEILTNSGVTATSLSSGGTGGVVFSDGSDISAALTSSGAESAFDADSGDGGDYSYWDKYKMTSSTPTTASTGNAISFPGYISQDGRDGTTADTAWVFGEVGAHIDVDFSLGKAYAKWERMSPAFSDFTNNVYYVRSGDGLSYYKLQVTEATYTSSSSATDGKTHYTFEVKFAKLD